MHKGFSHIIVLLLGLLVFVGCNKDDDTVEVQGSQQVIADFLAADSTLTAVQDEATGIWYIDLDSTASGSPLEPGLVVEAFYTIRALGGVVIDLSSPQSGGPAKMLYGADAIYPIGFDQALSLMKVGDSMRFFIPAELGYGDLEVEGLIPHGAVLDVIIKIEDAITLEQQLIQEQLAIEDYININDLNDMATPGTGIYIDRINELDSGALVGIGERVEITYVASFLGGSAFDATFGNETFTFEFGRGEAIQGLEFGLAEMFVGESALIIMPSSLAYGGSVKVMPTLIAEELVAQKIIPTYAATVGPFRPLIFEVTLLP